MPGPRRSVGGALRKRWLVSNFTSQQLEGTYWGIGSAVEHYEAETPRYSDRPVDDVISDVRTDLTRFPMPSVPS